MIFDYPSDWSWKSLPQGADFDYFRLVFSAYRAVRRHGLSVDILPATTDDLEGYAFVLAPGLAQIPQALQTAFKKTQAILGPRTNCITDELTIAVPMGPAIEGLDCVVTRVESLPPTTARKVDGGGSVVHWMETLEGVADVILATDGGAPVMVGDDTLRYLGAWPDDVLWDRIVADAAARVDLETHILPQGLRLRDTGTHRFAFNYGSEPVTWNETTIPAAGVAWWLT